MNRKILGLISGAIIGALALGACSRNLTWVIVGAILGGVLGFMFALGQTQMKKDRETGLDG